MNKIIIIKYGELSTKKDNINYFLSSLKDNIVNIIGDMGSVKFREFITFKTLKFSKPL